MNRFFSRGARNILAPALAALSAASPFGALVAQTAPPEVPEPSSKVRILPATTNGFIHPGIGLTKAILENARKQVIAKKEPWYSGYKTLAANPHSAKTVRCRNEDPRNPGRPEVDAYDNKGIEGRLKQDAAKAKRQALMYFFTGDPAYRANAMNIVRVWSKMDPKKYKNYNEAHIHASYATQDLIAAAELLRYTSSEDPKLAWTDADTRAFTDNFATPAIRTFLDGNGWFMNQNGYPLAASMSGDIFTNDRKNYEKRVEWFTVNKSGPNKGWSSSITDLARLVQTNAITGETLEEPIVQLVEMGRDQAHAGGDVEIFMNTARQMNAQKTRVDPATGTISTAANAVGPYEFLGDRILAAADQFCRFMLGYDTPWAPTPSDIAPDGTVRAIYPRIADNYRGRIRGLDFWDAYYYYASAKGEELAKKAPYYDEAFGKRIVNSDTDWIYIPASVAGEGARVPSTVQEPDAVEVELRSTVLDGIANSMREGETGFVRVTPTEKGTRIALLSCDTGEKTLALRVRTTGPAEIRMSGFAKPWILPDTKGQWRCATYTMGGLEKLGDIVFLSVTPAGGSGDAAVDLDQIVRKGADKLERITFVSGNDDLEVVGWAGAPLALDLGAKSTSGAKAEIASADKPEGSSLDSATGAFAWTPAVVGQFAFTVSATAGDSAAAKRVRIRVATDREAAIHQAASAFDPSTPYVAATRKEFEVRFEASKKLGAADDASFAAGLSALQKAAAALEPLTPRLPDGSVDFPKLVASSDIGEKIALLADENDDTFPVYLIAKDLNYVFDFGPGFQIAPTAFALEGRLNFESRTQDTAFFGSDDGKTWVQLTAPIAKAPAELARIEVMKEQAGKKFRYLKVEKTSRDSAPIFEPSELRIYGQRYEK